MFNSNKNAGQKKRGRGRSQATLDLIGTSLKIMEPCQPIGVRGLCYKLFVDGHIDSMAPKNTKKISRLMVKAREEGQVPWEWIVDESRELKRDPHWKDLEAYSESVADSYRRDFWSDQDIRLIVISEKSTVSGILHPVLNKYGVPFFSVHGFNSATKVRELAEEMATDPRDYVFLYVGDWDCSGMFMSEVDLPGRLERYGDSDFTFERVALMQHDTPGLPSFPAKKADTRYRWYRERYGTETWELDAMDPGELRQRIRTAIEAYIDFEAWDRHKLIEEAQRETTRMIAASFRGNDKGLNP